MCDIIENLCCSKDLSKYLVEEEVIDELDKIKYHEFDKEELIVIIGKLRASNDTLLKKLALLECFFKDIVEEVKQEQEQEKQEKKKDQEKEETFSLSNNSGEIINI